MSPRRVCRAALPAALLVLMLAAGAASAAQEQAAPPSGRPSFRPAQPPPPAPAEQAPAGQGSDPQLERMLTDARALVRGGKVEEGLQKLRDARKAYPEDARIVLILGSALEGLDRRSQARQFYRAAADSMKDPGPALAALERVCRQTGDYPAALQVCLEVLGRRGEAGQAWVADELESLIRGEKVGEEAVRALEGAIHQHPEDDRLRELLIQAQLHLGRTDKAVEQAVALDASKKAHGAEIYALARLAEDKGDPQTALGGYERVLKADPGPDLKENALLGRARSLRKLRRIDECLKAMDEAIAAAPAGARFEARTAKAEILDGELKHTEEALKIYQDLIAEAGTSADAAAQRRLEAVRLSAADCQLRLGHPSDAAGIYAELAEKAADPKTRAEAAFQAAEMLLYQGKLREASDAYYKLTDDFHDSPRVNDALERILLLGEDNDAGGLPVVALAQADYQARIARPEKGLSLIEEALQQNPSCRAADRLGEKRVELLLTLGRFDEASIAADTLAARFPESLMSPRALMAVAQGLSARPEGNTKAQAICLQILTRFPDSLEAPQARAVLARFKEQG